MAHFEVPSEVVFFDEHDEEVCFSCAVRLAATGANVTVELLDFKTPCYLCALGREGNG